MSTSPSAESARISTHVSAFALNRSVMPLAVRGGSGAAVVSAIVSDALVVSAVVVAEEVVARWVAAGV
jgi:hypothetical protein